MELPSLELSTSTMAGFSLVVFVFDDDVPAPPVLETDRFFLFWFLGFA